MPTTDLPLFSRHATDIIRILLRQIAIQIVQRPSHLVGMFLVHAEDDGLRDPVVLLEELGQVAGDGFRPRAQGYDPLKVLRVIFLIGYLATIAIKIALARTPAGCIPRRNNSVDAVRCKEPVFDALAQAVLVKRIAEVGVGVAVVLAKWSRRHAKLVGRL